MKPRVERLVQTETNYKHNGDKGSPGLFISGVPLTLEKSYFELELLNIGTVGEPVTGPVIGLCSYKYPLDLLPGTYQDLYAAFFLHAIYILYVQLFCSYS